MRSGFNSTFVKTTDGGATWDVKTILSNLDTYENDLYDAHFFDMNTGYACGDEGKLLKTSNGGATWDTFTVIASNVYWFDMHWVDANTGFLAGTAPQKMAKTTDGGTTWSQLNSLPHSAYYSVYAKDADNILAGSSSGNIRKSTNGGSSWSTINIGTSATIRKFGFIDANTGYMCGSSKTVRMTTDFGDTWTNMNAGLPSSNFYDLDIISSSAPSPFTYDFTPSTFPPAGWVRFNGLGTAQWIRSTTNEFSSPACAYSNYQATGGVDWLIMEGIPVIPGDSLVFWLRRSYTGLSYDWDSLQVYISTTSQDTTSGTAVLKIGVNNLIDTTGNTYPPRPGDYKRYAVSLAGYEGSNTYIAFKHKNFDGTGVRLDDISVGESRTPAQTNVYLTGNSSDIFKAPFGSTGWDTVQYLAPGQLTTGDYYSADFSSSGDTLLTVGTNGLMNVRYSPSNRVALTKYITDGYAKDIWAESGYGRVIVIGGQGNSGLSQVLYSTNGGSTWAMGDYPNNRELTSISMINAMTGYTAGEGSVVSKTTNGGANWTAVTNPASVSAFTKIVFPNENTGYVFGYNGKNYKTTNGGTAWNLYTSGHGNGDIYGASFVDANTGWTAGEDGEVYKTTNGGATTTSQTANVDTYNINDIQMLDANTGWLCTGDGNVRRTTNGGTNWDSVNVPTPDADIYSIYFADRWNGMATSTIGKVFRTRDGGDSWEFESVVEEDIFLSRVYMTSPDTAFLCGGSDYSVIIKYGEFLTGSGTFTNSVPDEYYLEQNYPNPFNPSTTIKFGLPREGTVSLKVYDITGREVGSIFNGERFNPGIVSYTFDGSSLASGIYFYALTVDNNIVDTKKMVLIK